MLLSGDLEPHDVRDEERDLEAARVGAADGPASLTEAICASPWLSAPLWKETVGFGDSGLLEWVDELASFHAWREADDAGRRDPKRLPRGPVAEPR